MCNFDLNSLENFINIISDNRVQTLKNRIRVRPHKISVKMSTSYTLNLAIQVWISDILVQVRVWSEFLIYKLKKVRYEFFVRISDLSEPKSTWTQFFASPNDKHNVSPIFNITQLDMLGNYLSYFIF